MESICGLMETTKRSSLIAGVLGVRDPVDCRAFFSASLCAHALRKHPHNCGAAPKSGHAVTAAVTAGGGAVAAAPARGRRTRSPPGSRVGRARFTRAVAGATA